MTELLTLKAGTLSSPFLSILARLAIPVVVSSERPLIPDGMCVCREKETK